MEIMGITSVAAITIICFLAALAVKQTALPNNWLPTICGALGAVLGIVGMNTIAGFPASDPLTAVAVGIVSGLAATGTNEAAKQLVELFANREP